MCSVYCNFKLCDNKNAVIDEINDVELPIAPNAGDSIWLHFPKYGEKEDNGEPLFTGYEVIKRELFQGYPDTIDLYVYHP